MDLKNGYKVIYEKASEGKRTFYASKTNVCDPTVDTEIASFEDAEYRGRMIFEYDGKFYISAGKVPTYDEDGKPTTDNTVLEAFDAVFCEKETTTEPDDSSNDNSDGNENDEGKEPETETPNVANPHAEAITANGDTHGEITVDGNAVTINATGEIPRLTSAWGTEGNWVGFRISVPEGVDAAQAIYTRPNGKASPLSEVLDAGKNYASVYSDMSKYGTTATYFLDWDGNGTNDLSVTIDVTGATLLSE